MKHLQFEMDVPYVRSLTYEPTGKINNTNLGYALTRGVKGFVDFVVPHDGEKFLDSLIEDYGIDFKVGAAIKPKIFFNSSVDGKKTIEMLRKKGIIIPKYVEDVVMCGETCGDASQGRLDIFHHDDKNALWALDDDTSKKEFVEGANKLELSIEYILKNWDFNGFVNPQEIQEKLRQASSHLYNPDLAYEAYQFMNTEGVVKNLFGDAIWRENAMIYGRNLLRAVMHGLKKRKAEEIAHQQEFIDKLLLLFSYYEKLTL